MKGTIKGIKKKLAEKKPEIDKIINQTKKKIEGRGGARKGAGRKAGGKKNFTYFLPEDLGNKVSKQENPSQFVEDAIQHMFENTRS